MERGKQRVTETETKSDKDRQAERYRESNRDTERE